jgi:16S rRNA (cytosine967-C5)-methyltransferase
VLARRPDARSRIQPADVTDLAELQRALLAAAAPLVRAGGTLVYSVCTLTNAETIEVDEWARTALSDFTADSRPGPPWREHGRGALLLPQAAGTDGMFVLRLRRRSA